MGRKSINKYSKILSRISYDKILNQIQDGIFITDVNRNILFWNKGAERLTGIKLEEVMNKKCFDSISISTTDKKINYLCKDNCPLQRAISKNTSGLFPHIVFLYTKWGLELPIALSVAPLHDQTDNVVGGIMVFQDMRDEYRQRKLAGEIQKQMITLGRLKRNGFLIDTYYKPVDEIGGDFIEAFFLDDKSLVATVADATGHGISASLFTVIYKTLLHSAFSVLHDPAEVLNAVNKGFVNTTKIDGYYLTATMVCINPYTMRGKLSAAGHPSGLIFKKSSKGFRLKEELSLKSMMIGVEEHSNFQQIDFSLKPDEFLILTSDGLIEAECSNGKRFGIDGIEGFFATFKGTNNLESLVNEVSKKSKYIEFQDDVSIISISPVEE